MGIAHHHSTLASNVGNIQGTGMGLAKRTIDFHGGRIMVNSELGIGTTFIVE